ncbi:hypothetical protein PGT21_010538 [Puccinia graminis f. sp. tritici]|uniref:Uncharacterized protein n=1 Tax=Puccinia graminis f. sp. tritici TaxID=56615 RepID=A0A5B0PH03_PUCGR|nr:hypothetical protein PGT21_010538 [Puccinia graminis f. sp. tritici]KAA1099129.1 hypothetical protein PGTUg99_023958 [Puccinia graminis f. sp. tritici]
MDPWSSNDWVESTEPASSSTLQLELDLKTTNEQLQSTPSTWPVPDLSLPNWDNPSPPKSSSPPPTSNLPLADSSQTRSQLDPATSPIETLTINTHISSPASSSQSVFKTPDSAGSDKWVQSNQSPVNEPPTALHEPVTSDSIQMTSSAIAPSISADLSHPTQPAPDPDPDLDRWGTFTQTDLPPIASVIPFPEPDPPSFASTSPIESGWNGETHLGGWDDGLAIDHSLLSLGTSDSIPRPDENNDQQGWSSPHFSDPDHNDTSGDDWGQSKLQGVDGMSPTALSKQTMDSQKSAHDQSAGSELAGHVGELSKDPLPESSARSAEVFQSAMSKTAQAATNAMNSAMNPRSLFPNASTQSSVIGSSLIDSSKHAKSMNSTDNSSWGDCSALGASHHPQDSKSGAFGVHDPQKTAQQQEQKKRTSFFGFWSSKSPPTPSTTDSLPTQKMAGNPSVLPPIGVAETPVSSSNQTKGSVSSVEPPSAPWPTLSPASPDPQHDPAPSAISRLFGRLGARSNHASISTSAIDEQSEITAPSTELNANDIKFLDHVKTVPIEAKFVPYDDFPSAKNANQNNWTATNTSSQSESGIFDFLSENSISKKDLVSRPVSSNVPGYPNGRDPFEFLDSLSPDSTRQKRSFGDSRPSSARLSSSPKVGSIQSYSHFSPSSNHPSNSARHASLGASDQKISGDDLDELFSHFQGAEISPQVQSSRSSPSGNNPAALRGFQKPLGTKSVPPLGSTQVRMASTIPKPILPRDSNSFSAISSSSSSKVPILAPPPSSSRPSTSGPIPLIPPPQHNVNKQVQNTNAQFGALNSVSPSQNVTKNLPFQAPSYMTPAFQTSVISATKPGPPQPNKSNQAGGLSKEDLSFFDSLI